MATAPRTQPHVAVVLLLACGGASSPANRDGTTCPCGPASLCRPLSLSPQPPQSPTRPEVVAYHSSGDAGRSANAWSAAGLANNGSSWRSYDWTKVTTIGLFGEMSDAEAWDLLCTAHSHNVRVLLPWYQTVRGQPNPVIEPYNGYRQQHIETFANRSFIAANAKLVASFVVSNGACILPTLLAHRCSPSCGKPA